MSENNFEENMIDHGYQMDQQVEEEEVQDHNPIVPPLNVTDMPTGVNGGYSAPLTANLNYQIPPLPVSHQGNKYSINTNNNHHFA